MIAPWKSRIVGHDLVPPDQLLANPLNWRLHPMEQRDALSDALDDIGFVRSVTVNKRTGNLVDGHERVWQALKRDQPLIEVEYVDLSEEEERKALAWIDPIGAMAKTDGKALAELMNGMHVGSTALQQMLAREAENAKLFGDGNELRLDYDSTPDGFADTSQFDDTTNVNVVISAEWSAVNDADFKTDLTTLCDKHGLTYKIKRGG